MKTVAQKMGIKEGSRALFMNAPDEAIGDMHLPPINRVKALRGAFDYIHLFVKTQAAYGQIMPALRGHLKPGGMLWVSWPKNRQLDTDLSLPKVIEIGYAAGLVESTTLSINPVWSAIKFTHPKEGKVYKNSYGKLNQQPAANNR